MASFIVAYIFESDEQITQSLVVAYNAQEAMRKFVSDIGWDTSYPEDKGKDIQIFGAENAFCITTLELGTLGYYK